MASNEWTEYHLTREGWLEGDRQQDFSALLRRAVPADRVLSVVYKETSSGIGAVFGSRGEVWRSDNEGLIAELLKKFGDAPNEL